MYHKNKEVQALGNKQEKLHEGYENTEQQNQGTLLHLAGPTTHIQYVRKGSRFSSLGQVQGS